MEGDNRADLQHIGTSKVERITSQICCSPCFGKETMAVTKGGEKRMGVAELKMLRYSQRKMRMDRVENVEIIKTLGVAELRGKLREIR